jgi:hypothetical protein
MLPPVYRLGKTRPVHDRRTLLLPDYLRKLPEAPVTTSLTATVPDGNWGMLANDRLGDCTCAAAAHMDMIWTAETGQPAHFTDDQVIEFYNRVNGGSDDGAVELFVLSEWRRVGGVAGRKIDAYVSVPLGDGKLARSAMWLFHGLYLGVALPYTAQGQDVWDVPADRSSPQAQPGSWGGHAINMVGYDAHSLYVITWGAVKEMTWAFWDAYVEEAWAILPSEFENKAPGDFDFKQLQADIAQIGQVNPPA